MSGTKIGGMKTREANLKRDPDFYKKIGGLQQPAWEANGRKPRGFSTMSREAVAAAGKKGGTISRRGKAKNPVAQVMSPQMPPSHTSFFQRLKGVR